MAFNRQRRPGIDTFWSSKNEQSGTRTQTHLQLGVERNGAKYIIIMDGRIGLAGQLFFQAFGQGMLFQALIAP